MPEPFPLQQHLDQLVIGPLAPGAVIGLLQNGEVTCYASGFMETEKLRPMSEDATFRISSMYKPIVALALLQLVDDGLVSFDDPVARWLPELNHPRVLTRVDAPLDDTLPAERPITVEHLLSSRLGTGILPMMPNSTPIQREISRLGLIGFGPDNPADPMSADTWLHSLGQLPLLAQPGCTWFYNISTLIQGILVSRIAGRPLSAQIAERITGPLGMTDTGFVVPADKSDRLTAAYSADMTEADVPATSAWLQPQRHETSMVSTAQDYLKFASMLHDRGRNLVSEGRLRLMLSDHLTPDQRAAGAAFLDGRGWGYGLSVDPGHQIGDQWTGEVGWAGGLGTSWTSHLGDGSAIVILGCRAIDDPEVYAAHVQLTRQALG